MGLALTVMLKLGLISSVRYKTCGPMRGSCDLLRYGCREKMRLLQHRYKEKLLPLLQHGCRERPLLLLQHNSLEPEKLRWRG